MDFQRKQKIEEAITPKRVLLIYGPRRVGKTTLLKKYIKVAKGSVLYTTGDDIDIRRIYESEQRTKILSFVESYDVIGIDEAQEIPKVGLGTKMIIDEYPEKNIILTGSSSFGLSQEVGAPLTGRHFEMLILPLSQSEISMGSFELNNNLDNFLIYGAYPEVLLENDPKKKELILRELISSYLFKDVMVLDKIKSSELLFSITKCLAFQVGNEVSYNEIAKTVGTNVKTVIRYIDLLEKIFVIKRIRGFSKNLRNEISKKAKYYFLDNGVRNASISNFNALENRDDIGALWENFIFMELYKKSNLERKFDNFYFWRTHTGEEIDIVIESDGKLIPFECKWNKDVVKTPKSWLANYKSEALQVVNKDNYLEFLILKKNNSIPN